MLRNPPASTSFVHLVVFAATFALAACGADEPFTGDAGQRRDGADGVSLVDAADRAIATDARDGDVDAGSLPDAAVGDADAGDAFECGTPPTTIPSADRNTNSEFTDPPTCTGCPGAFSGLAALNTPLAANATTVTLEGTSTVATSCEWYVVGGSCGVTHGTLLTDPDGGGNFQSTIPVFCGTNIVRVVCSNSAGHRVYVRQLQGTQCEGTGRDLRLTLTWDNLGTDMELHLVRDGGHINTEPDDCTWFTCVSRQPMWGPDTANNPRKDVDNTSYYGPENIYLDRAVAGTYHVLVEYWGGGTPSTNEIDVTIRERTVAHLTRPMLPVHAVWYVGTVSFPGGTFTPVDTITACASNWRLHTMGCDLPLP
jgi:hypothetical protein